MWLRIRIILASQIRIRINYADPDLGSKKICQNDWKQLKIDKKSPEYHIFENRNYSFVLRTKNKLM